MKRRLRLPGVPVFVYHGIAEGAETISPGDRKYWVRVSELKQHLNHIRANGHAISLAQLTDRSMTPNPVVITFDDGRLSDYEFAYPELQKAGMTAEFFVNTAKVGTRGFADWSQLREMQHAGMSIQSHAHDHVDLALLAEGDLERQLSVSKNMIEERLGTAVQFLAAPYGRLNAKLIEIALKVGYRSVCSARSIPAQYGATKIDRVVLHRDMPLKEFAQYFDRDPVRYLRRISRSLRYRWPLSVLCRPASSRLQHDSVEGYQ
ncbi:MAG TPA: polysaccharide deacetylase family protein [Clostridia bacterium]|nr:polysaccharide deacetylase family protein [Clostridia bacterium]